MERDRGGGGGEGRVTTPEYDEPVKVMARERCLSHAVRLLTTERASTTVVRPDEVWQVLDYALGVIRDQKIAVEARSEFAQWRDLYSTEVGGRRAGDLKVLFLCGPKPLNDLEVLLKLGVNQHNVWAVEADEELAGRAVSQLTVYGTALKVHSGPLKEFLEALPESFDLLYLDGCGPVLGRKPNALAPLLAAAFRRRLAPHAVLVTNFSSVPEDQTTDYAEAMSAFFRYRYNDFPAALHQAGLDPEVCAFEDGGLANGVVAHEAACYSDFLSRLLVDLFRGLAPSLRAMGTGAFTDAVTARGRSQVAERATASPPLGGSLSEWAAKAGDVLLNPRGYPLHSFFTDLQARLPHLPLVAQLAQATCGRARLPEALLITSLLGAIYEGHWDLAGGRLLQALRARWFDGERRFSCDVALPNLLVGSLLGVYGYPKFPVPERASRVTYTAKTRTMYMDVLPFDECRYYFDWFPTIDLVPARFSSRGFQVLARCIMDRLSWSDFNSESHPFHGGAVACQGDVPCAVPRRLPEREELRVE